MTGARRAVLLAVAIAVAVCLLGTGTARAAHDGGADCYDCHNLNGSLYEQGTHFIARAAMSESKARGWTPGMRLGCTFCHRSVNSTWIPDVLSSFSDNTPAGASRHPVSRNYITGAVDNTPYLSTDNTVFLQHLDCIDCHDVTLTSYPNHDNTTWLNDTGPAGRTKSTNPFGLRNVTSPKAYDAFCRGCHAPGVSVFPGGRGKTIGKSLAIVSHDNAIDNAANAIRDLDDTHLRTQDSADQAAGRQCSVCHDAHESQNLHLFSDGHETTSAGAFETAIDEMADCTTVCHYRGDPQGNYDLHGHGKPTDYAGMYLNRECTLCHEAGGAPHNMKNFATDNNYWRKYRFQQGDQSWLTPSVYGKPERTVCATCHGAKIPHTTARGNVGCIDCHDQHAKSSDNNVMMIRDRNRVAGSILGITGTGATIGSEPVLFRKSERYPTGDPPGTYPADGIYHYSTDVSYQGDTAAGFCDQRACHGARSKGGTPFIPMNSYVVSAQHSGGTVTVNADCEGCHGHQDIAGSFRAQSACNLCHGQPPPPQDNSAGSVYVYNEFLSPHRKHGGARASGNYGIPCQSCHVYYTDGNYHNTRALLGYKTFQSVFFDNAIDRGGSAYDNGTLVCTNIYCHSDGRGGNPVTVPRWFDPAQPAVAQRLGCGDCHSVSMASGGHAKHLGLAGVNCSACHVNTVNDNASAINPTTGIQYHVNRDIDVTIKAMYDMDGNPLNNYDNTTKVCSQITCHGGNDSINWNTTPTSCEQCHSYDLGVPATSNRYDYTFNAGTGVMSTVALGNFLNRGHGDNNGLPWDVSSVPALGCGACHDSVNAQHDNTLNPFRFLRTVNARTVAPDNVDSLCTACHTNYPVRSLGHSRSVTGGGQQNWTHTQKCVDCHDVHGQSNIYMVYDNMAYQTDNTNYANSDAYGIPLYTALRTTVSFTTDNTGISFAGTDNAAPFDGICEVCHRRTMQYRNAAGPNSGRGPNGAHPDRACIECHAHGTGSPAVPNAGGFRGIGGNSVEQFFDNVSSATNYNDLSGHPVNLAALWDTNERNCLGCHGRSPLPGTFPSNECLKCHFEFRSVGTPYHPNGVFEWPLPGTPGNPLAAYPSGSARTNDTLCLQCHAAGGSPGTLGGLAPTVVVPGGETWTAGSGHGAATALSSDVTVGPPAYHCGDCHYSSVASGTSPNARDRNAPTFHASINRKMAGNTDNSIHEYPHPSDTDARYDTPDERSGRMDWFCGTKCHGNAGNGIPRDDNVVTHTWNLLGGGSQAGDQTHPSNMAPVPSGRFRAPDNLPLSEYLSGALPGSGNEVCVTCHNPHGGASGLVGGGGSLTGGNKQMMRRSFSDNVSTVCKECHL